MESNESIVIRDVKLLGLGNNAERLAEELIDMIDMPVVFEINSHKDKNYAGRHPLHHNQFWVIVRKQNEKSEYERIILSNLYRGIQERKRLLRSTCADIYINKLMAIKEKAVREKRIEIYCELVGKVNALATTVDAEIFMKTYGIETSSKVKQNQFEDRRNRLQDYLRKQKGILKLHWYPELELHNIIDYSRIAYWNDLYHKEIAHLLGKTYPKTKAIWYVKTLNKMVEMLKSVYEIHKKTPEMDVVSYIIEKTCEIVGLKNIIDIKYEYAMKDLYVLKNGEQASVYSFVPEGISNEKTLIKTIKHINEGILLLQDFYVYIEERIMPDVHVNLIDSRVCAAYADGNAQNGYFISFTTGMLEFIDKSIKTIDIDSLKLNQMIIALGEDEIKNRIYRYALYFVAAHEYAHILNNDCDNSDVEIHIREEREARADKYAYDMMRKVLFMQYRPENETILKAIQKNFINAITDKKLFDIAYEWCREILRKM